MVGGDLKAIWEMPVEMVLSGFDVHAVPVEGGWLEIDTVADYESANRMMEDQSILRYYNPNALASG